MSRIIIQQRKLKVLPIPIGKRRDGIYIYVCILHLSRNSSYLDSKENVYGIQYERQE